MWKFCVFILFIYFFMFYSMMYETFGEQKRINHSHIGPIVWNNLLNSYFEHLFEHLHWNTLYKKRINLLVCTFFFNLYVFDLSIAWGKGTIRKNKYVEIVFIFWHSLLVLIFHFYRRIQMSYLVYMKKPDNIRTLYLCTAKCKELIV